MGTTPGRSAYAVEQCSGGVLVRRVHNDASGLRDNEQKVVFVEDGSGLQAPVSWLRERGLRRRASGLWPRASKGRLLNRDDVARRGACRHAADACAVDGDASALDPDLHSGTCGARNVGEMTPEHEIQASAGVAPVGGKRVQSGLTGGDGALVRHHLANRGFGDRRPHDAHAAVNAFGDAERREALVVRLIPDLDPGAGLREIPDDARRMLGRRAVHRRLALVVHRVDVVPEREGELNGLEDLRLGSRVFARARRCRRRPQSSRPSCHLRWPPADRRRGRRAASCTRHLRSVRPAGTASRPPCSGRSRQPVAASSPVPPCPRRTAPAS